MLKQLKEVPFPSDSSLFFKTESGGQTHNACLRPGVMFSLNIEVSGKNEIEATNLRVNENGKVILPIIGAVEVDGLTIVAASARLSSLYRRYYVEPPLVRIQFAPNPADGGAPWGYVTVLGRVSQPGQVNLPATRDLTVSGAIQGAGGLGTSANQTAVRITRIGEAGKKYQTVVNLNRIGSDGATIQDVPLKAGDLVFVPKRIF